MLSSIDFFNLEDPGTGLWGLYWEESRNRNLKYLFFKLFWCVIPDPGVGQLADNVKVKILQKFSRTHALTSLSKESLGDRVCLIWWTKTTKLFSSPWLIVHTLTETISIGPDSLARIFHTQRHIYLAREGGEVLVKLKHQQFAHLCIHSSAVWWDLSVALLTQFWARLVVNISKYWM